MEIKEFISEVIVQIRTGIADAETKLEKNVLPESVHSASSKNTSSVFIDGKGCGILVSNLEFEISLTAGQKDGKSGGIGVFLGSVGVGAKGNKESEQTSMSKIKFNLPILLDSTEFQENKT